MAKTYGGIRGGGITNKSTPDIVKKTSAKTIQGFANEVLADGLKRGREFRIGTLNEVAQRELRNQKIELKSTDVVTTDDVILKYVCHPKRDKNATLPENRYDKLKNIVNNPTHVYIDQKQRNLALIFTSKKDKGKVIKAIIQPNTKVGKNITNKLKSIGVVAAHNMEQRQYRKIK